MKTEVAVGAVYGAPTSPFAARGMVVSSDGRTPAGRAGIANPDTQAPEMPAPPEALASRQAARTPGGARTPAIPATDPVIVQILIAILDVLASSAGDGDLFGKTGGRPVQNILEEKVKGFAKVADKRSSYAGIHP